jgi:hypothetical protein
VAYVLRIRPERRYSEGNREEPFILHDDEGPEKVIPHAHKSYYTEHDEPRLYQREDYAEVGKKMVTSVNFGGINNIIRGCAHILAHDEDAEGPHKAGNNKGPQGINPLKGYHHHVQGNNNNLKGHHHGEYEEEKESVSEGKADLGKRVARKGTEEEVRQGTGNRNNKGSPHIDKKTRFHKPFNITEIGKAPFREYFQLNGKNFRGCAEAAYKHKPEREKKKKSQTG